MSTSQKDIGDLPVSQERLGQTYAFFLLICYGEAIQMKSGKQASDELGLQIAGQLSFRVHEHPAQQPRFNLLNV